MEKTINILIIADDIDTHNVLRTILRDTALNLIFASSKKEALKVIEKQEIGIIIVDIALKKIDPSAFIRSLRLLKKMSSTYTLILTDTAIEAKRLIKILRDGAVDYITHPFDPGLILAKVNTFKELYFKQRTVLELLENILPKSIISEFNSGKKPIPENFESATVLFIDIVGFTKITKRMSAFDIVHELDKYFQKFDAIIQEHGLEKIKTIGDAYMAVAGVPIQMENHALAATHAAYAIKKFMDDDKKLNLALGREFWEVRIGVHTGPLVGGVIGTHKFTYDVWGETVNTASRLESNSEPDRINISHTTYDAVKDYFDCEYRGKFPVKHGGEIPMYFANTIKKEYLSSYSKHKPSMQLRKLIGLEDIDFEGFKTDVTNRLKIELDENLYYHDLEHSLDVVKSVCRIGGIEGVSPDELFILKSSALIHDAGFIHSYDHNEELAVKIMIDLLEKYGYTSSQINKIQDLILATRSNYTPQNLLESIIRDADHDYLGREDYYDRAEKLHLEMQARGVKMTDKEWIEIQINYLENKHQYFTNSSKNIRQIGKEKRIKELKWKLKKMS